ncbi:MAG: DUF975 family protein [Lactobacillus sp.]|nr:DUF975 family protein [Lactobacillus sp.]MCI2033000.1 DUF975 family protein [Lactobacillus sp.]
MTRAMMKQEAKDHLRDNWGWAIGLALLGSILSSLVGSFTFGILAAMVSAGVLFSFLDFSEGHKPASMINGIFSGFSAGLAMPVFLTNLLVGIFVGLWSLLLVIPGVIKAFSYSQANYILKDMHAAGREIGATDAITASRELMDGHKWEYFVLQLSFIGWACLATLTLGIGFLWLVPYISTTNAVYYRQLAGNRFLTTDDSDDFSDF